jgi:hypothetical protein
VACLLPSIFDFQKNERSIKKTKYLNVSPLLRASSVNQRGAYPKGTNCSGTQSFEPTDPQNLGRSSCSHVLQGVAPS